MPERSFPLIIPGVTGLSDDPFSVAADRTYEPYFCEKVIMAGQAGMYPEEWAAMLGVSEAEMKRWKEAFPEFELAFARAETALRARVTGVMRRASMGAPGDGEKDVNLGAIGSMAKVRFPDLYGKRAEMGPAHQVEDSPSNGGQNLPDSEDELRAELKVLRARQDNPRGSKPK